jgi:hypothetical protein
MVNSGMVKKKSLTTLNPTNGEFSVLTLRGKQLLDTR